MEEDENGGRRRGMNRNRIKTLSLKPAADRSILIVGVSRCVHSSFRICESERKLTKPAYGARMQAAMIKFDVCAIVTRR
jgi:hypothetical protein